MLAGDAAVSQVPQRADIEIRKVRTLVDRDGRGFNGPPKHIARISGGRYVLVENASVAVAPVVIDSNGRFIKALGRVGEGPGEFLFTGPFRVLAGDTLALATNGGISLYGSDLRRLRTIRPQTNGVQDFLKTQNGFVITKSRPGPNGDLIPFHVTDDSGVVIRSFGSDSAQQWPPPYALTPSTGGAFWATPYMQHRFERWTTSGTQTLVIDTLPAWYAYPPRNKPLPRSIVNAFREVDGRLWVVSMVPVPNIDDVVREATGRKNRASEGGPRLPMEKMYTSVIEAYDAMSGKLIAELTIRAFAVAFIDDRHFMIYSINKDDLAQLEIWEMKLKP